MTDKKSQRCYICKAFVDRPHNFYPGLCISCGDFNQIQREQTADLQGKIALVTGARVKIGRAVTLKLLRAGAQVIATTRFPNDAAQRYAREEDFEQWRDRLSIYSLDLKNPAVVEQFAYHIRNHFPRLDIIINNAAQTVRRPAAFYRSLEAAEMQQLPPQLQPLLALPPAANNLAEFEEDLAFFPPGELGEDGEQLDFRPFNSWLMKDDEVSILELLEVHLINAIAPFILNSRLKPLMQAHPDDKKYIINVSSMEGRFNGVEKPWRHPHTNMAKASLHMMTRTCAKEYARYRIYMNCVDPGWVSFQHPHPQVEGMRSRGVKLSFDYIDAAARICAPIFVSLNEGRDRFGQFYKDYAEVEW
ncbi:SDR family oxidoreductase [Oscillatoria sp. FACHB-1406]|uniref:SDR family NAD(P)-dependent oxidoreductase n=1 Tax=Oscillatoria sp. FACHB-1406 TaxID=2692846 RepID=UPI001688D585|nr:SDR family oxidoreductase [Oscillatoria sp. FACHB-1406]MBD2576116.1 SDR family oxidoreductase [Oscillatoria sp. FACHB-1406]